MLVYGDHSERADPRSRLTQIAEALSPGTLTHDQLTSVFIALAGVAQGVADADFQQFGMDRPRPAERQLLSSLMELGSELLNSWETGRSGGPGMTFVFPADLPCEVEVKLPEGYAFYGLYPESYALAARRLKLGGPPRIIGLRSIGTGLACIAAVALEAEAPITLRPTGDPFSRSLRISPELEASLLKGEPHFIIVDEGPGLSGSSFGAVADWLEDRGVPPSRIAFLPGHSNAPGPCASERHRERWAIAQRPVVDLSEPQPLLLEPLIGPINQPLHDISAGTWRPIWSASEADWPAIDPTWERRKFLARAESGTWLVKFAGLGAIGQEKLDLARKLQAAGFGPEVAGLAHGWLVTRWHEDAAPARPNTAELAAYLRLRRSLPANQPGASSAELLAMIRRNIPQLERWSPDLSRLSPTPVCTDNRMAAHEWLRLPSGQLLKADAVDHHAGHDLVGCQDIAWDVAGASIELDLTRGDEEQLVHAVGADAKFVDFYRVAYCAFRIGAHRLSAGSLSHWPEERARHLQAADKFEQRLASIDAIEHLAHVDQPAGPSVETFPG